MNIIMITGSPHKNGTSAILAEQFQKGAEEAGHNVDRFDAALEKIHPCIGCDKCGCGEKPCVFQDDMQAVYSKLIHADVVVYVSPLYYHNLSAQLKRVIDRYHGIDDLIRGAHKKVLALITGAYPEEWIFDGVKATVKTTVRYLGWKDCGGIYAYGCRTREDILRTEYPQRAYELGMKLSEVIEEKKEDSICSTK